MESLVTVISKTLDVEKSTIKKDSSPENTPNWDSYNSFMLITDLESNFNVKFSSEEIMNVKNVEDIIKTLRTHGVKEELLKV